MKITIETIFLSLAMGVAMGGLILAMISPMLLLEYENEKRRRKK